MSWVQVLLPLPIMADVAKWLTHQIVALAFGGSIPLDRPMIFKTQYFVGESPSGKATDFDSVMRRFDPFLPSHCEPLAQLVEHLTFNQGVEGSSPSWLTSFNGGLAQLVEHLPCKQGVSGSNPLLSTIIPR